MEGRIAQCSWIFLYLFVDIFVHVYNIFWSYLLPIHLSDPPSLPGKLLPHNVSPSISNLLLLWGDSVFYKCVGPSLSLSWGACALWAVGGTHLDLDLILMPMAMPVCAKILSTYLLLLCSSCPLSSPGVALKVIAYLIAGSFSCTQPLGRSLGAGSMSRSCLWCWVQGPAHDKSSGNSRWWTNAFWYLDLLFMSILDQASLKIDVFRMNSRCSQT